MSRRRERNASAAATRRPACPRCGYDVSGPLPTWTAECPVEGICPECGFGYRWVDVLHPERNLLRWFFLHAPRRKLRALAVTVFRAFEPVTFWRSVRPSHPVSWLRAGMYLVCPVVVLYLALWIGLVVEPYVHGYARFSVTERLMSNLAERHPPPESAPGPDADGEWHETNLGPMWQPADAPSFEMESRSAYNPFGDSSFVWYWTGVPRDTFGTWFRQMERTEQERFRRLEEPGHWVLGTDADKSLWLNYLWEPGTGGHELTVFGPSVGKKPDFRWGDALQRLKNPVYFYRSFTGLSVLSIELNPYALVIALPVVASSLLSVGAFGALPFTLSRARIRSRHIVRAGALLIGQVIWVAAAYALVFVGLLLAIDALLFAGLADAETRGSLYRLSDPRRSAEGHEQWQFGMLIALMVWQCVWWWGFARHYLRVPHALASALAVWVIGWLACAVLIVGVMYVFDPVESTKFVERLGIVPEFLHFWE